MPSNCPFRTRIGQPGIMEVGRCFACGEMLYSCASKNRCMQGSMHKLIAAKMLLLLALQPGTVAAAAAEHGIFQQQTWTTEHGLPANHVTALWQTRDEYLWIGTRGD